MVKDVVWYGDVRILFFIRDVEKNKELVKSLYELDKLFDLKIMINFEEVLDIVM